MDTKIYSRIIGHALCIAALAPLLLDVMARLV